MPRSTLKLPAKPPATPAKAYAADGERTPARKPIRGASKVQQAASRQAKAAAPPAKRFVPRPNATVDRERPRPAEPARAARATPPAPRSPRPPLERPAPVAKVYPKRGIARSTGARALPPARPADESPARPAPGVAPSAPPAPRREDAAPLRENPAPLRENPTPLREKWASPRERPAARPATRQAAPPPVAKPTRGAPSEPPRLAKRLTEMTGCSRREADEWIENGWVSVDGKTVTTLGVRVHPGATVAVKDDASRHHSESVTILFNKPAEADEQPASELIGAHNRWAEDETRQDFKITHLRGLVAAGKLDGEASGMLVFTQEGSVIRRITSDETRLEKEYLVRVEGELSPEGLKLLGHGLALDDIKLKRAQVSWQNEEQLRFVLHESRKQQISRMCALVGVRASAIKRIRIGSVSLGKLPPGQWRYLRENERF